MSRLLSRWQQPNAEGRTQSVTPESAREGKREEGGYPASLQGPSVLALGETPGPLTHKAFTRPA